MPKYMETGAQFDDSGKYRYRLWRRWGSGGRCVFVGLNPSTADESKDDPTIRRCVGFAKLWGFGALDMVNLFAWRSTDPGGLLSAAPEHVGPGNDEVLAEVFGGASRIVWAWGRHKPPVQRLVRVRIEASQWLVVPKRCEIGVLGRARDGSPRHPLYLANDTPFVTDEGGHLPRPEVVRRAR